MKTTKKILRWILFILCIPVVYVIVSLILTFITVHHDVAITSDDKVIYLNTNGVHLDIVMNKYDISPELLKDLVYTEEEDYISFGWGDENFYINTLTWADLTFGNAVQAVFLESTALMHLTRYKQKSDSWVEVKLSDTELDALNRYILESFKENGEGRKVILSGVSYSYNDNFYKANGSYSYSNTCNTWVNTGFLESGLKSCAWTPFDFGLMGKYE